MSNQDIFCLTNSEGDLLPPAVQATVLAKYSRSPLSAREIVKLLTEEEADKFQEKWTIGYGHSSVAELAVIPVCFEGVSIIASKFLESFPRAGYSEKSTRYQEFSEDSFVTPPGCPSTMKAFAASYFAAYKSLYPKVLRRCAELMSLDPSDPSVLSNAKVKARAFDNVRYLLPAGTGTSLGAVLNLRDARYLISAARGHSNPEIRQIGDKVHAAATEICPTLVKDSEADTFEPVIQSLENHFNRNESLDSSGHDSPHVVLTDFTSNGTEKVKSFVENCYGMTWESFSKHMESRGNRQVPRAFENASVEFHVTMDYGAYRDLQRHRRLAQYAEPLTPYLGYVVPDDIAGTELEAEYRRAMELVHSYDDEFVVNNTDLLQYMIPLGYLHKSVFRMDLKELYYLTELRTKPQGHISYRRIAYDMFRLSSSVFPELLQWCRAIKPDSIGVHTLFRTSPGMRLRKYCAKILF